MQNSETIADGVMPPLYVVGALLSLGMNFGLYGWSWKLLWALASWANVGFMFVSMHK